MIDVILGQLIENRDYFSRVWPYLRDDYFEKGPPKHIFNFIKTHVDKYNAPPSKTALELAINQSNLTQNEHKGAETLFNALKTETKEDITWLVPETEKFIKAVAISNATMKIIAIQANEDKPLSQRDKKLPSVGAIADIMKEAISIGFDNAIGHNWMSDYELRWLQYKNKTHKIPFKIFILDKITKGGVENGTLNILLAGVNVGKSLGLCSLAADYLQKGKNVLYFSMEMAEHVVAKRIDANLLDVSMDDIDDGKITYEEYKNKMERWRRSKQLGELYIKQYPTGSASALTFKSFLNELKLKQGFVPDIIIVDYLGICASSRIKVFSENSYTLVKAIAEELRALAVEAQVPIWTGAQTTRGGWDNSDITMGDIAESAGLAATADFILAVIETEELALKGVQLFKQIKSRYGDKNNHNKFELGVKKGNQRWFDVNDTSPAPKIPNIDISEKEIIENLAKAKDTIPITKESELLDRYEELMSKPVVIEESKSDLKEAHRIKSADRTELERLIEEMQF